MVYDLNFEIIESIKTNGRNPKFFNDYKLSENITGSHSIEEAIAGRLLKYEKTPLSLLAAFRSKGSVLSYKNISNLLTKPRFYRVPRVSLLRQVS